MRATGRVRAAGLLGALAGQADAQRVRSHRPFQLELYLASGGPGPIRVLVPTQGQSTFAGSGLVSVFVRF